MNGTQTVKKSKSVYIIGAITLGIIALLVVYFVLIATGVISAEPVRITIASASGSREYNGKEFTKGEWSLTSGELKDGHTLSVTVTGGRTDAGECENTVVATVFDERGYDVTNSYGISYDVGTLTVVPRKIVVASASAEKYYDGLPLTAKSCALTEGALVAGHELIYTVNGTLTSAGKTDNTFVASVTDGKVDVSKNYDIEYLCGTLYVHGEMLNIKTGSATKTYDGDPLTCDVWTMTSGTLRDGDEVFVTISGSQTEVGESENVASVVVRDSSGVVVTPRYEAVFDFGTLTVKPITIFAETMPAYKIYDGTPLTGDGWRVISNGMPGSWLKSGMSAVVGEYIVTAIVTGERTDAGVSDNTAAFEVTYKDGTPAEGVAVECSAGALTVALRNLTVQSGTKGKPYDGTPLTCDEYSVVSITQVAEGQKLEVAVSGTITFNGITDNTIAEVKITDADGNDVTHNYNIKLQEGKLSIISGDDPSGNGGDGPGGGEGPGDGDGENGNVPGGGSGGGDVDGSGNLGGGDMDGEEGDPVTVMKILSDVGGTIYMRQKSFGDYNFNSWGKAEEFGEYIVKAGAFGSDVSYGMNYLTGVALRSSGLEYYRLEVQPIDVKNYYLPAYTDMTELNYSVQSSDVVYTANNGDYALYFYNYDCVADKCGKLTSADLGEYSQIEQAYRKFVYENYLAIPDSTHEYMVGLIDSNGFAELSIGECISAVAQYIRGAASYNMKYDRALDDEPDVAVAFLDKYKEGICQHYATSAVLLLRAIGIPARYTVGYSAKAVAGDWADVLGTDAHAWVEAYIDGAGWVTVEVTGGGPGFGGNGGSNESNIGNADAPNKLTVKPYDVYLHYNDYIASGSPLTYTRDSLQGLSSLDALGYTYEFTVTGSQDGLGMSQSVVKSLKIFDNTGADITDNYNITLQTGKLQVYMQEISISTGTHSKMYDGKALVGTPDDFSYNGTLLSGHEISEIIMTGGRTDVGRGSNNCEIVICDEDGNDVTYMYKINSVYGTLAVYAREITVTAGSKVGYMTELNGEPLTCDEYVLDGELCEGDSVVIVIRGSQSGVGRSDNTVEDITIVDADGNDVTKNYAVTVVNGTLTVLPRRPANTTSGEGD